VALHAVSLAVEPGQIVAVLGASGSGKSTLLRAIAGLVQPSAGRISLEGRDLAPVATHRRDIGLMFQNHALFGHLNAADNVGYGLKIAGVGSRERTARVGELLALVGLESLADRRPDQLSGGEAQRIALARALAPRPGLLMLDEPLGSLDRSLRESLTEELSMLLRSLGQTALHVTHDQQEAFALADRLLVLDRGRVVADGRPDELWANPQTAFLARFLGRPNVWPIEVEGSGQVSVLGHRLAGTVPTSLPPDLRAGDVVVPIAALAVAADPSVGLPVTVLSSRFDRGRYRLKATLAPAESASVPPEAELVVSFLVDRPVSPGSRLALEVAVQDMIPLT
jgi:thiamine transport system ATP-binding protein